MPHVHLDRKRDRDLRADILDPLPGRVGHPRHVDEQVVRSDPDIVLAASHPRGERVHGRADTERRENVRRDLETEVSTDRPGLLGRRIPEIDLAAHDHMDELVRGGEPLRFDAGGVLRILVAGIGAENVRARAFEIAEGGAASGVEQRLDGSVGMRGRVMDLRDVVHRGDAVIELGEPAEQLVDVDVLRPVHGGELEQDEFEIGGAAARRARAVVDENAVGEEAAQRRLELVMVRIDEAGHDNAAAGVDLGGAADVQVRSDRENLLALDKNVGPGKVAHMRVHRHHGAAANDITPAWSAAVRGRVTVIRRGRARREQVETRGRDPRRGGTCQEFAARSEMVLWPAFIA